MNKLLIIQVSGGIGNQLFQLANAYQLSLKYNRKLLRDFIDQKRKVDSFCNKMSG